MSPALRAAACVVWVCACAPVEAPDAPDALATAAPCTAGSVSFGVVEGRLVDERGLALADEAVSLCGSVCVPARTRSDGRFSVRAGVCFAASARYPGGAVLEVYGDGYHADVSIDVNPARAPRLERVALGDVRVPSLFAAPSVPVPLAGDSVQRLELPDGFSLRIAPGSLDAGFRTVMRVSAVRVERGDLPPFYGLAASGVAGMYAVAPSGARCTAPAAVTLPNDAGLAPGAAVEFVMVGEAALEGALAPGSMGVVDTGRVSDDGRAVTADHGLPHLGWVGFRARR